MKKIPYYKYHCLGNDFLIIDRLDRKIAFRESGRIAQEICARNSGVGADGILLLFRSLKADCRMEIYNSDGSWAEKSGNGLRITAAYLNSYFGRKREISIETATDIAHTKIVKAGKTDMHIRVSLGRPKFNTALVPIKSKFKYHINRPARILGKYMKITALSVGNPHTVIFVDHFDFDWKKLGHDIETAPIFPHRTNVEFVRIISRTKVFLNDWERGAGATGSSGTGAAAAVVAGALNGLIERKAEVIFPTGSMQVDWAVDDDQIYLTGPVRFVGRGEYFAHMK
jgi:diaminopimelate epimerase